MTERLIRPDIQEIEPFRYSSFVFPGIEGYKNTPVGEFLKPFNSRSTDFKKGDWGFKEGEGRLTRRRARKIVLTVRPDVFFFLDPLQDSRAAHFRAEIPNRSDGKPLPAMIGVLSLSPNEENPRLNLSHAAGNALRPLLGKNRPGYYGTIMGDLDAIFVFSEKLAEEWEKPYPEQNILVLDPADPQRSKQAVENIILSHGRPRPKDWDEKPPGGNGILESGRLKRWVRDSLSREI